MEALLDQADALVRAASAGEERLRPELDVPEEYGASTVVTDGCRNSYMVLQEEFWKGRGWFAATDIPAGTLLLVAKPIAMVMDWQDDENDCEQDDMEEEDEEDKEPRLNEWLLLEILQKLRAEPTLWKDKLSTLFPRENKDLSTLPAWVCHNDEVFLQVESLLTALEQQGLPSKEIAKRLPLILRYNILSMETCAELLSYPGPDGHSSLAGVGLYHWPSFFNHSAKPNVARWCVGDVMGFVTNQAVRAGTELCISYIEHDVLCEPAWRRNQLLAMDFIESADDNTNDNEQYRQGPDMPVVDSDVQNELMSMDPFERLSAIDNLMLQAVGEKRPEEAELPEGSMETDGVPWFQCDVHNLRILKAITLDGLGQAGEALQLWQECVAFVEQQLPPLDESLVVLHAQAALCAWHAENAIVARQHAASALETHRILFGGGVPRFRRRLDRDLKLSLRPLTGDASAPADSLWPIL